MTDLVHIGPSPRACPACAPAFADADHLGALKLHRVYGRITANSRRAQAANRRRGLAIADRAWREHFAAQAQADAEMPSCAADAEPQDLEALLTESLRQRAAGQ